MAYGVRPQPKAKGRKPGSKSQGKFTPERIEIVMQALRSGLSYQSAAKLAGISPSTLMDRRATDDDFYLACEQAITEFESRLVNIVDRAAQVDGDWKAAAWILERKFKKDWAKETQGDDNGPAKVELKWNDGE